jgi:hypothetical protein
MLFASSVDNVRAIENQIQRARDMDSRAAAALANERPSLDVLQEILVGSEKLRILVRWVPNPIQSNREPRVTLLMRVAPLAGSVTRPGVDIHTIALHRRPASTRRASWRRRAVSG